MASLQDQVKTFAADNAALQANLDALQSNLNIVTAENETLAKVNDALTEQVEALSNASPKQAAQLNRPTISKETFLVDGKKYGFNPATPVVLFQEQKITAVEVLASPDLQRALIEAEASFIQLQP